MALLVASPINNSSINVLYLNAAAQKEFWDLVMKSSEALYVVFPPSIQKHIVIVNTSMSAVVRAQEELIGKLEDVSDVHFGSPDFGSIMTNLERVVLQINESIANSYDLPDAIFKVLQPNLEKLSALNSHVDNHVESFRIALDESCSAALADLATSILHEINT